MSAPSNARLYWLENVPARGGEVSLFSIGEGRIRRRTAHRRRRYRLLQPVHTDSAHVRNALLRLPLPITGNHLDGFKVPVLVLQGADDPVVPPSQSQRIVNALRARQGPVAYILYPGESHGFRKPETIINSLQAELAFYGGVLGFEPAHQLPPLRTARCVQEATPRSWR
jgi:acetyl esterase/lipase